MYIEFVGFGEYKFTAYDLYCENGPYEKIPIK